MSWAHPIDASSHTLTAVHVACVRMAVRGARTKPWRTPEGDAAKDADTDDVAGVGNGQEITATLRHQTTLPLPTTVLSRMVTVSEEELCLR